MAAIVALAYIALLCSVTYVFYQPDDHAKALILGAAVAAIAALIVWLNWKSTQRHWKLTKVVEQQATARWKREAYDRAHYLIRYELNDPWG